MRHKSHKKIVRTHAELAKMSSVVCAAQIRHTLLAGRKNLEAGPTVASELRQPDLAVVEARLE